MESKGVLKWFLCFLFTVFLLLSINPAHATVLNSHFGINLSVNGNGNFNNSWVPTSSSSDYIVADWNTTQGAPNPSPFGSQGEAFDVEAIYFDNDNTYAYFAIVTSNPATGYAGSMFGWPAYHFDSGDIAIDLNSNDPAFNYQYGIKTIGSQAGTIKKNSTWNYDKDGAGYPNGYPNQGFPQMTKFDINTGTLMGNAVSYNYYNANLTENGWATWVVEGVVMLSSLGSPSVGSDLTLRFSPDCNNDLLFLHADIDSTPVPEPYSILLLGMGLIGLFTLRKRIF